MINRGLAKSRLGAACRPCRSTAARPEHGPASPRMRPGWIINGGLPLRDHKAGGRGAATRLTHPPAALVQMLAPCSVSTSARCGVGWLPLDGQVGVLERSAAHERLGTVRLRMRRSFTAATVVDSVIRQMFAGPWSGSGSVAPWTGWPAAGVKRFGVGGPEVARRFSPETVRRVPSGTSRPFF